MATAYPRLNRDQRSVTWYLQLPSHHVRGPDGSRKRVRPRPSTGITSPFTPSPKALADPERLQLELAKLRPPAAVKRRLRERIEYDLARAKVGLPTELAVPTLARSLEMLLADREARNMRPGTLRNIRKHGAHFLRLIGAGVRVDHIGYAEVSEYLEARAREGAQPSTRRVELQTLRALLRLQVQRKRLPSVPDLPTVTVTRSQRRRYWTEGEFAEILAVAREPMRSLLIFSVHTGLRDGELCHLRWDWISDDGTRVTVQSDPDDPAWEPKSRRTRTVPLNADARAVLEHQRGLRRRSPYVFPSTSSNQFGARGERARERAGNSVFRRLLQDAGVYRKGDGLHTARLTFGAWLASRGVPLRTIQAYMGHTSVAVTERYYADLMPEIPGQEAVRALESSPADDAVIPFDGRGA